MIMDSVRDLSKEKDIIRIIGRMPDRVLEECVGNNCCYGSNRWHYYLLPNFVAYTPVCSWSIESIFSLISLI